MDSHKLVFVLAYILIHVMNLTIAQPQFLEKYCIPNGNYTSNSTYQTNLNRVLNSISSNTMITSGFYNFSEGQDANKVNAIGLCRGDVEPNNCRACLNESSLYLKELCPNQKEAIGWTDYCMLRYSNRFIFGASETLPNAYVWNINNVTNVVQFNTAVRTLLGTLGGEAAKGGSVIKFATGNISVGSDNLAVYGLVQCTPDLSERECNQCLNVTFGYLPKCCDGKIGGRVLTPSCHFRYEIGPFYNKTTLKAGGPSYQASPPGDANPPQVSTAPPPALLPPQQSPPSGKGKRIKESLVTLSAITTAVTVILFL